jgi:hypothetical protein
MRVYIQVMFSAQLWKQQSPESKYLSLEMTLSGLRLERFVV